MCGRCLLRFLGLRSLVCSREGREIRLNQNRIPSVTRNCILRCENQAIVATNSRNERRWSQGRNDEDSGRLVHGRGSELGWGLDLERPSKPINRHCRFTRCNQRLFGRSNRRVHIRHASLSGGHEMVLCRLWNQQEMHLQGLLMAIASTCAVVKQAQLEAEHVCPASKSQGGCMPKRTRWLRVFAFCGRTTPKVPSEPNC